MGGVDWAAVAAVASLISSGTGLALAASGGKGINLPSTPQVKIPDEDMATLNQQIASNAALSDQARAAAKDAIAGYQNGQLSQAYAGQYEALVDQQLTQLKQGLAAQGFTEGSTQWQNAMQSFQIWSANLKSQMLQQQLQTGLQSAGLADTAINDLFNKWGMQIGAANQATGAAAVNTQGQLGQSYLGMTQNYNIGKAIGNLGTTLATPSVQGGLKNIFTPGSTTPPQYSTYPQSGDFSMESPSLAETFTTPT